MAMAMIRLRQFLRVRLSGCLRGFGQLGRRNYMGIPMRMILIRMAISPAGISPCPVITARWSDGRVDGPSWENARDFNPERPVFEAVARKLATVFCQGYKCCATNNLAKGLI
jgi:hypothetical protein